MWNVRKKRKRSINIIAQKKIARVLLMDLHFFLFYFIKLCIN